LEATLAGLRLLRNPAGAKEGHVHPHRPRLVRQDHAGAAGSARDIVIRPACIGDAASVARFLAPFVARGDFCRAPVEELHTLLRHGFVAEAEGSGVGFTALEIYSEKLAEVQCVSVDEGYRGQGIGRRLVARSVDRARQLEVAETMAITAREEVLRSCGFDDCLPGARSPSSCTTDAFRNQRLALLRRRPAPKPLAQRPTASSTSVPGSGTAAADDAMSGEEDAAVVWLRPLRCSYGANSARPRGSSARRADAQAAAEYHDAARIHRGVLSGMRAVMLVTFSVPAVTNVPPV